LDQQAEFLVNALQSSLAALQQTGADYGAVEAFANANEQFLLADLQDLAERAPDDDFLQRVRKMQGVLRYQIYADIPARKQQQVKVIREQLNAANASLARAGRIQAAADRLPANGGASDKLKGLDQDAALLAQRTEVALQGARQTLIASMLEFIGRDEAQLLAEVHGLRYDIARLIDEQYLAEVTE
jgi:hypothetical protein